MEKISSDELGKLNGKDGKNAYVAVDGKVYDLSSSPKWKNGEHMKTHFAGQDLSEQIKKAPHSDDVLKKFPTAGELAASDTAPAPAVQSPVAPSAPPPQQPAVPAPPQSKFISRMKNSYRKKHPHPMLIHFPIALFIFTCVFYYIYLFTHRTVFELTSYHLLTFAVLTTPFAVFSGYLSWTFFYESAWTRIFTVKILGSILLLIIGCICLWWRTKEQGIIFPNVNLAKFIIYTALLSSQSVIVIIVAYFGGKITFS